MNPPPPQEKPRLRFRFAVRDLLWAMVLLAVALGWWRTYRRTAIAEHNARVLEGTFRPGELSYDSSGRITEMPRWSPASRGPDR